MLWKTMQKLQPPPASDHSKQTITFLIASRTFSRVNQYRYYPTAVIVVISKPKRNSLNTGKEFQVANGQ